MCSSDLPIGRHILYQTIPREGLVKAMVWFTVPATLGPLLGPALGGALVTYASWRLVFLMSAPICVIGIVLALKFIDVQPPAERTYHGGKINRPLLGREIADIQHSEPFAATDPLQSRSVGLRRRLELPQFAAEGQEDQSVLRHAGLDETLLRKVRENVDGLRHRVLSQFPGDHPRSRPLDGAADPPLFLLEKGGLQRNVGRSADHRFQRPAFRQKQFFRDA